MPVIQMSDRDLARLRTLIDLVDGRLTLAAADAADRLLALAYILLQRQTLFDPHSGQSVASLLDASHRFRDCVIVWLNVSLSSLGAASPPQPAQSHSDN